MGKPVHYTSVSGYAQSRGDQINVQRVFVLSSWRQRLYRDHCADDAVGGDVNIRWVEAWNEVQAAFLTFILG